MAQSWGERGFDQVRFGWRRPSGSFVMGLAEVLPLLSQVAEKLSTRANDLNDSLLTEIVRGCAGLPVQFARSELLEDALLVSLARERLELSTLHACGLRDLIFSACLFRTYVYMGRPPSYNLDDLISETWLMLADELPQSLTYSTAATLEGSLSGPGSGQSTGSPDIHFHAA